jgi:hypothetical protein
VPTRTTYVSDNELARLAHVGRAFGVGIPTLIRLGVKLLLDDPLPAWAQEIVDALREPSLSDR